MHANSPKPTQCAYVLVVHRYLSELGANIPRAEVRSVIQGLPNHPQVSVKDVLQALETWQVPAVAFKAKMSILPQLDLPVMAFFRSDHEGYFVLVTGVDGENVTYYSPIQGEITEPFGDFEARWSGVMLAADTDEMLRPLPDSLVTDAEAEQGQRYKQHSVKLIDDFFTAEECRHVITHCEQAELFARSEVDYGNGQGTVAPSRTSYSAGLKDREDPIMASIYRRVAGLLQVPEEYIENLQCVRYGEGEEFRPHYDSGESNHRVHTLLVYLNDDFAFGETYFPELDLKVKPRTGTALYFLNRSSDGEILLHSAHAGLPVKRGIKYGCNIWVRDRPYEGIVTPAGAEVAATAH